MAQGPSLIFDKSSLESLNLDEAVLLDNFYRSTITPLFFVECLADLEKAIRSKSTPEQLVGSIAARTPESQCCANVHHTTILQGELARKFNLNEIVERPMIAGGKPVQLEDKKGMLFQRSPEEEALERWTRREFLGVERSFAKEWRAAIMRINHDDLVKAVRAGVGNWRKPKSLPDAKEMADFIIDNMDPEWLIGFGLELLGVPVTATALVRSDWTARRRPAIREYLPYFTLMLTINVFFSLVLPTQLLRDVKPSHQIDLAYLYYLPFCSVFTSRDRFHVQIVPLFLNERQTFVHGDELKQDLRKLDEFYSGLPEETLRTGLWTFANTPPEDSGFLVTRLWDRYLPAWRTLKGPQGPRDPEADQKIIDELNRITSDGPEVKAHDEHDLDKLDHVAIRRSVFARKGKWRRFSEEQEKRMERAEHNRNPAAKGPTNRKL